MEGGWWGERRGGVSKGGRGARDQISSDLSEGNRQSSSLSTALRFDLFVPISYLS